MAYIKAVSDQPITRFDHVVVAVMGKFSLEPVGGLARATASNRIRHDDEVFRRIERLPGRKQIVGEARAQPIRAGASVALQEQYAIDDLARCIAPCRSKRAVVELQLGQRLAGPEHIVRDDEVALLIIRPSLGDLSGISRHLRVLGLLSSHDRGYPRPEKAVVRATNYRIFAPRCCRVSRVRGCAMAAQRRADRPLTTRPNCLA